MTRPLTTTEAPLEWLTAAQAAAILGDGWSARTVTRKAYLFETSRPPGSKVRKFRRSSVVGLFARFSESPQDPQPTAPIPGTLRAPRPDDPRADVGGMTRAELRKAAGL